MVKEERSLRTRRVAGSKRRIARRTWWRILRQPGRGPRAHRGTARRVLDRLNAFMKPTAFTRPQCLSHLGADGPPAIARVDTVLVVLQLTLRPRSASKASAAR